MPDTDLPSPAGTARTSSLADDAPRVTASTQSGQRYAVERCPGGGGRAVYAVLDMERIVTHRVICRTNFADANMIVAALTAALPVNQIVQIMPNGNELVRREP